MKKVCMVFSNPVVGYAGGVANIVRNYQENSSLFSEMQYELDFFDFHYPLIHKLYHNKSFRRIRGLLNIWNGIAQTRALKKETIKKAYEVVHIHTSREFTFLKDVFMADYLHRVTGRKIVLTIHVGALSTVFKRIPKYVRETLFKCLNRSVSSVIFLSESIKTEFVEAGLQAERAHVLYNFHVIDSACMIKGKSEKLRLLFMASIHREKGILEALEAIEPLQNRVHLDICGIVTDETIRKEFESRTSELGTDVVTIHGYVSGNDKLDIWRKADVLLLPSYHEGMPLVILEALASGCAIVATPVGACPEILSDDNVIWVDVKDSEAITKAIESLMQNQDMLRAMQQANARLGERFGISEHVVRLCDIYGKG